MILAHRKPDRAQSPGREQGFLRPGAAGPERGAAHHAPHLVSVSSDRSYPEDAQGQ
jgi:hypothetical protein